jgi:hypothetical protein
MAQKKYFSERDVSQRRRYLITRTIKRKVRVYTSAMIAWDHRVKVNPKASAEKKEIIRGNARRARIW